MLNKVKNIARNILSLEQRSEGAVPPSPLFLVSAAMKAGRKIAGAIAPPTEKRLTGRLAIEGGLRVRDTRLRPYSNVPENSVWQWTREVGPVMARLFCKRLEGSPQTLSKEFGKQWAAYCGTKYALLLPHCTDALRIALAATLDHDGMEYGGEVIVPNLGFIASANSALGHRFGVALVDVDPDTLNIDPRKAEEAIIPGKTRAIMAVHSFGQPADMAELRDIAKRHSLVLIEDSAQAHGAIHVLGRTGTLGDAAGFSFQSAKNLSSGEGGALTTGSAEVYARADSMHNVGRAHSGTQRWLHVTLGWNLRPSEYVAAVLLHRLKALEAEQETRFERFNLLRKLLADVHCVQPLGIGPGVVRHGVYMFVMRYKPARCGGLDIEGFLKAVGAEGIPIYRCYEETLAQQPALLTMKNKHPDYLRVLPTPVSDQAVKEVIYISHEIFLGPENDIMEIAAAIRIVEKHYDSRG